jgi:hypothetical protein
LSTVRDNARFTNGILYLRTFFVAINLVCKELNRLYHGIIRYEPSTSINLFLPENGTSEIRFSIPEADNALARLTLTEVFATEVANPAWNFKPKSVRCLILCR